LAAEVARQGQAAAIVTVLTNRTDLPIRPGTRIFVPESGEIVGWVHAEFDHVLIADAREALRDRRSQTWSFTVTDGQIERVGRQGGTIDVFVEVVNRPARLVIAGAGHIAVPLATMATLLDFEVTVIDDRAEYANRERFPNADVIQVGAYRESIRAAQADADTAVVLVTRGHVHDQACLEEVIDSDCMYIGMIGSKRRVRTVLRHLLDAGHSREQLARVHAPIGLDIAAQTPAEIAVAILAEIIAVRRGGKAASEGLGAGPHV
jgi:xanthine dehydrogenase accessory factor